MSPEEVEAGSESARASFWSRAIPRLGSRAWRRTLAWFLLVLGCILLPLAVTGGWVRGNIFSTDGFVDTFGPLASEPAIQETVADSLTTQIFEALVLEELLQDAFPDRLGFLAGPVVDQLQEWTRKQALRLLLTDEFATIWTSSLRVVHGAVVDFFEGTGLVELGPGGVIQIDLSAISTQLVEGLEEVGVLIPGDRLPAVTDGKVPLVKVEALENVRALLSGLNKLFILLPILAVVFLAGSVAVSIRRQRAAVRVGIGMMISMAVFIVILAFSRMGFLNATEEAGISRDAAGAMWGVLTIALRGTAWGLFFVGLLLLVHPHIVRLLRGDLMSRAAERAAKAGVDTGRAGKWVAAHRVMLAVAVLIIGVLVLVLWSGPGLVAVIVVAVIVLLVDCAILLVARASDLAVAAMGGNAAVAIESGPRVETTETAATADAANPGDSREKAGPASPDSSDTGP